MFIKHFCELLSQNKNFKQIAHLLNKQFFTEHENQTRDKGLKGLGTRLTSEGNSNYLIKSTNAATILDNNSWKV